MGSEGDGGGVEALYFKKGHALSIVLSIFQYPPSPHPLA